MRTLLVSPAGLAGDELVVADKAYRHLFRAARVACGERLRVVDGAGRARLAEVIAVDRRSARVRLGEEAESREPALRVELLVAPPKLERAAWLVEKATELGVAAVRFLGSERDPRSYGAASFARLVRVAESALEQCGGSRLPAVSGMHGADELPALIGGSTALLLDPGGDAAAGGRTSESVVLLIGPEGGWSDGERAALLGLGVREWSLGPRPLRVETAAIVAASRVLGGLAAR